MVLKLHNVLSKNCTWAPTDLITTVRGNMYCCNIANLRVTVYYNTGKYSITCIINKQQVVRLQCMFCKVQGNMFCFNLSQKSVC